MIITKILECKYKVLLAVDKPFSKFGVYRKKREHLGFPVERRCFNCDHEFNDDEDIYLIYVEDIDNRFLCEKCNNIAVNDLNKEKENDLQ